MEQNDIGVGQGVTLRVAGGNEERLLLAEDGWMHLELTSLTCTPRAHFLLGRICRDDDGDDVFQVEIKALVQ
jgi:hypothetical protein